MRKRGRGEEKMGRAPCCNKGEVKKGAWTPEEDKILVDYITKNGHGTWRSFPKLAGLRRCGKSCRLRWTNYLRPDIKRGAFTFEEEQTIFQLHSLHGNKWAAIAARLPGRTDNEIKNYWNSHLRKRIPIRSRIMPKPTNTTETRPSMDPMLPAISDSNSFLSEWGSGVKEALEKPDFNTHQASSMIKVESDSVDQPRFAFTSTNESCDHMRCKIEAKASDSQNSYETENSSDLTLDLLLDFPIDGEYLEYV